MHNEKFEGTVKNFWNKKLTELKFKDGSANTVAELKFEGVFEAFGPDKGDDEGTKNYTEADWDAAYQEMKEKNELPTVKEQVAVLNNRRKAATRQKLNKDTVVGHGLIEPTIENDPQLRLRDMYKLLRAGGMDHEEARTTAASNLKTQWADGN